ncbi:hypothetical protein AX761_21740 [Rhizobium sp. 58]|nr:hypothetical protein AX761_21740 [Rhizobium sp. 58]
MSAVYNSQPVLGVRLVSDGTLMHNGLPVIGIVDASGSAFVGNLRTLGVSVLGADQAIYNDQPVRGAVVIADGRKLYNNSQVLPYFAVV